MPELHQHLFDHLFHPPPCRFNGSCHPPPQTVIFTPSLSTNHHPYWRSFILSIDKHFHWKDGCWQRSCADADPKTKILCEKKAQTLLYSITLRKTFHHWNYSKRSYRLPTHKTVWVIRTQCMQILMHLACNDVRWRVRGGNHQEQGEEAKAMSCDLIQRRQNSEHQQRQVTPHAFTWMQKITSPDCGHYFTVRILVVQHSLKKVAEIL